MREQLSGACTTEIAAFDEFANLLSGDAAAYDHVVFDTAPTGHSLLLMDATGAYHRQMLREYGEANPGRLVTPVSQAAALQDDLRRAKIEPFA